MPILGSVPDASRPCGNHSNVPSDPGSSPNCTSNQLLLLSFRHSPPDPFFPPPPLVDRQARLAVSVAAVPMMAGWLPGTESCASDG
ncbi:hypothetical protein PAMP_000527 [Pampus punctatissimus]